MICMIDKLTVSDLTTNFVTLPKLPETEHWRAIRWQVQPWNLHGEIVQAPAGFSKVQNVRTKIWGKWLRKPLGCV
jgi:hypothetical protein